MRRALMARRRGSVQAVLTQLLAAPVKVIGVLAIGHYLSRAEIGTFGVITAVTTLVASIIPFGGYLLRSRPGVEGQLDGADAASVWLHLAGAVTVVGLGAVGAVRAKIEGLLGVPLDGIDYAATMGFVLTGSFVALGRAWLQSSLRHQAASLLAVSSDVVWVPFFLVFGIGSAGSLHALLLLKLLATIPAVVVTVRVVDWRGLRRALVRRRHVLLVLRFSAPLAIVALALSVAGVADRIVLAHYVSPAVVGRYTFMYMLYGFTMTVSSQVDRMAGARAVATANAGDVSDARRVLLLTCAGHMAIHVGMAAALVVGGPVLTALTGKSLLPSPATVALTGIALGLLEARGTVQHWLRIGFRTGRMAGLELLAGAIYAGMLVPAVIRWGPFGAALALAVSGALALGTYVWADPTIVRAPGPVTRQ